MAKKTTKPDEAAKRRMMRAAADPSTKTAQTGGARRVQSAADKNAAKGESRRK